MKSKKSRLIREEGDIFGSECGDTKFLMPSFIKGNKRKNERTNSHGPAL